MLLIGSAALINRLGGEYRNPKDFDYICTHQEAKDYCSWHDFKKIIPSRDGSKLVCFGDGIPVELEIAWPGTSAEEILRTEPSSIATLNTLYLLKMSHRYLKHSPHFEKTRNDILFLRRLGAKIMNPALLKKREKETYNYPHPNLNQGKDGFFDPNQLRYVWEHDTIHLAMAYDPLKPAYTKFQTAAVKVSREMWEQLDDETKLQSVVEEAYVLALERSQVPFRGKVDPAVSFKIALQRLCSSISSGWWREWAWEHYDEALKYYNPNYLDIFDKGVADGIVKPDTRYEDSIA